MFVFRFLPFVVFIFIILIVSLLTAVSRAALTSPTSDAEFVLNQGSITSYINTLFNMSESLPDGSSPRNGASARLEGCVRPELFQAVANSIVFISSSKGGAKNVSECLSYCAALRRLDYWMQTSTNYQNDVSLYELTSGVASINTNNNNDIEGTCWCLPQNMTTVVDVILWANTFPQSKNNMNATPFNDIFLPPSCCGPQNNPILSNPGATYVDARVTSSAAPSVACPTTVSASERASLVSIFTSKFTCGITSTCGTAAGCIRHPVFKPPISLVKSFDACVPLRYPVIDNKNDNNQNDQGSPGLNWNPLAYVILAFAGVFILVALCCLARSCFRQKREEDARERLLRARGIHSSGAATTPTATANVSNLLSNTRRNNNGSSSDGSSRGDNDSGEDVQVKDERTRARQLLSRLPVAALATRPMETCRQMAAMVLSSAFKTKPTPKALSEISSNKIRSDDNNEIEDKTPNSSSCCCCSICLDRIDAAPATSDQTLAKLPQKIMLPQCGHFFHTLCLHRQLIFAAQKMDENNNHTTNNNNSDLTFLYSPSCAVCGCEIIVDPKILEQVESVAVGRRQVVNSNPLL